MTPNPTATNLTSYINTAVAAGCPRDQIANFLHSQIVLLPCQLRASAAARLCDVPGGPTQIGYGGARGGGKSHWLLAQLAADDCQRMAGLKALLLRKVGKANIEHMADLRTAVLAGLPHDFSPGRGIITLQNGSRIIAGHFQKESDIDSYLGIEYDIVAVEEATGLSLNKYQQILTCCRSSKPFKPSPPSGELSTLNSQLSTSVWRPRAYATTNPGGVGHAWFKQLFIQPWRSQQERATRFVPATIKDNPFVNAEYRHTLEVLPTWQRRGWLEGDWDIEAGQFFTTWQDSAHVIDHFDPARAKYWSAAMDYGYTHPTVFLLGCRDTDNNLFVIDEHAQRMWLPQRHATVIKLLLERYGLKPSTVGRIAVGADVFARESNGYSPAREYEKHGLRLRPARTDRVLGWAAVLDALGDPRSGVPPKLFIHRRCQRLIASLPAMQHDPNRPEDVLKVDVDEDGEGGDDAVDALRYLVATPRASFGLAIA